MVLIVLCTLVQIIPQHPPYCGCNPGERQQDQAVQSGQRQEAVLSKAQLPTDLCCPQHGVSAQNCTTNGCFQVAPSTQL